MFVEIFGRPGCPYCVRAKQVAEQLTEDRDDFEFRYVDINVAGLTKDDLAAKAIQVNHVSISHYKMI